MPAASSPLLSPQLIERLERLDLVSRKIFRGQLKGERRSPRKGQSVEFADYRAYVPGDDLRFLDWNTYARLDRLFLKLFQEEEDLHLYVLLDDSQSMTFGSPSKFAVAQQLAAALGYIALVRADRVKIETLSQGVQVPSPPLRGRSSVQRLCELLERIEPGGPTALREGIRNFRARNPGPGVVVLLTDLLDKAGYQQALRYLVGPRLDGYLIQVLSTEELAPSLTGDLRLVDCEDADEAEITISAPLLARYRRTLEAFVAEARDFCHRRGLCYLLANNQQPVEELVTRYLRERGLVRG